MNPRKFLLLVLFILIHSSSYAEELTDTTIGLNYPGIEARALFKSWAFSLRAQATTDTSAVGARVAKFVNLGHPRRYYYIGGELSHFEYVPDEAHATERKTKGVITGAYLGIEYILSKHVSFNIDAGPYYVSASNGQLSADVFDVVTNTSINFFFKGLSR